MSETNNVQAILSAKDTNFTSTFKKAMGLASGMESKISSGIGFGILTGIGQKAFSVLSGAASNLIGSVVDVGKSFEAATSQIAATMGKPKSEIQDIIAEAERLGATTAFTATEAAEGFNILAMSGLNAEQQIAAAADVLNLAAAGAESMDAAAKQVVGTLKGWGIEADALTEGMEGVADGTKYTQVVADMLAKGASLAATDVNALGTALSDISSTASGYRQSMKGTTVALLRLAEQNVTGAEAATALNRAMMDLYTPTSSAAAALDKLGVSAYDENHQARDLNDVVDELSAALSGMSDEEANAYKNAIFSTFGLQAFNKMAASSSETVDRFNEGLGKASDGMGTAAEMASTQLDNLQGDLTRLGSATDGIKNSIYSGLQEPFRSVVQLATAGVTELTEKLQGFSDWMNENFDFSAVKDAISENGFAGGLAEVAKQVTEALPGLKTFATAIAGMAAVSAGSSFLPLLSSGFTQVGMSAANFGLQLKGLPTKAAAGFKSIAEKVATVGGKFTGLVSKIPGVKGAFGSLQGTLSKTASIIKEKLIPSDSLVKVALDKLGPAGKKAASGLGKGFNTILKTGTGVLGKMTGALTNVVGIGLKALAPAAIVGAVLIGLGALYNTFKDQIDQIIDMAIEKGPGLIQGFVNGITSKIPELMRSGTQLLVGLLNVITANLPALLNGGIQIITSVIHGVIEAVPQIIPAALDLISSFATTIIEAVPQLIILGLELLQGLLDGVTQNLGNITESALTIITTLTSAITDNLPTIIDMGLNILLSLAAGIISALPEIILAGIEGITALITTISDKLPDIINTGVQIVSMLVTGIVQNLPAILQAAVAAIKALISGIAQNLPVIISAGISIIGTLIQGLLEVLPTIGESGWEIIKSLAQGLLEAIPAILTAVIDGLKGIFTSIFDFITGKGQDSSDGISETMEEMSSRVESATSEANSAASANLAALAASTSAATEQINSSTSTDLMEMPTNFETAFTGIEDIVGTSTDSITQTVDDAGSDITSSWDSSTNDVVKQTNTMTTKLDSELKTAATKAEANGRNLSLGLARGMTSQLSAVRSAATQIVEEANRAAQAAGKIHSPSRVWAWFGEMDAAGLINSYRKAVPEVRRAAADLLYLPDMRDMTAGLSGWGDLSEEYSYNMDATYTIVTVTELDGREVGRSTAKYTQEELNRMQERESRKNGRKTA